MRVIVEVDNPVMDLGYLDQAGDKAYAQLTGFLKGSKEVRAPFTTMPDKILEQVRQGIMERMPELLTLD